MSFNWLDIVLGAALLISFVGAVRNGLSKEIIRLIALLVGVVGGMWWYREAAAYWRPLLADESIASFAGFLTILFGALLAGMLLAWILAKLLGWVGLRWFDRLLGGAFGLVRGVLVCGALVMGLLAFTPLTGSAEAVAGSQIAPWVLHAAQATSLVAPSALRQAFDENFARVKEVWVSRLSQAAPLAVSEAVRSAPKESPVRAASSR